MQTPQGFLKPCQNLEKKKLTGQFKENSQRKGRQALIHRTTTAMTRGLITIQFFSTRN